MAAFLAAFTVGTAEEWFEWFIPARVGELRDVLLNSVPRSSRACSSVSPSAPARAVLAARGRSCLTVAAVGAAAVLRLRRFWTPCTWATRSATPRAGRFGPSTRHRISRRPGEPRARVGHGAAADAPGRLSREDQYMSEGLLHVQARNILWAGRRPRQARGTRTGCSRSTSRPCSTRPRHVSPPATGGRPPSGGRRRARRSRALGPGCSSAGAGEFPIFTWPHGSFGTAGARCRTFLAAPGVGAARRLRPPTRRHRPGPCRLCCARGARCGIDRDDMGSACTPWAGRSRPR